MKKKNPNKMGYEANMKTVFCLNGTFPLWKQTRNFMYDKWIFLWHCVKLISSEFNVQIHLCVLTFYVTWLLSCIYIVLVYILISLD